jgi:hypothetical protein
MRSIDFSEMDLADAGTKKWREPKKMDPRRSPLKAVASAGDTGRTSYGVKLSARLTPGNDALHK